MAPTTAPMTSSPSTMAPIISSPSKTVPSTKDGAFTCYWKFYSSQPGSVFQQDSLMTSSAVDSETVPEFDYFYYVIFASVALGSLLTLLIQASLYCCNRKAYAVATADCDELRVTPRVHRVLSPIYPSYRANACFHHCSTHTVYNCPAQVLSRFFQIISKVLGRVCDQFLKPSQ